MHYYQFNIGDYASHTRHLLPIEDIAYRRLLDMYYLHEQPLNACSITVARLINMRDNVQEVEAILNEFFVLHDGEGWRNPRADAEIERFHDKQSKASAAGKASAARRSSKRSADAERTLNECSADVQPTINHKPLTTNQDKDIQTTSVSRQGADCPHQKLIDIYHEAMPTSPAVKVWSEKRQQMMRARWRERMADKKYQTEEEGLAYWKRYFEYCATSPFLTGKVQKGDKPAFTADMEWLINSSNFVKVIEGRYHGE